ncbi:MAG: monofunctional biosynthetic peptidoglycan transglycosylase [Bosea sp. (in: a-proteobacteria)]
MEQPVLRPAELDSPSQRGRSGWRRAVLWLLALLIGWPVLGTLLFAVVPPPSTLMLGRWLTGQSVERQYVPLAQISPQLVRAVIASEDQRFCVHHGIDLGELRAVLSDGNPSRGASTLTMQVAKNVFLWPGRSYVRKIIELPLALWIDLIWSKRRIMEVYLNIAEWGDGLYGAEAAAQVYFGKRAAQLDRVEAARLARALPNPILRNPGQPGPQLRGLSRTLLARMDSAALNVSCLGPLR